MDVSEFDQFYDVLNEERRTVPNFTKLVVINTPVDREVFGTSSTRQYKCVKLRNRLIVNITGIFHVIRTVLVGRQSWRKSIEKKHFKD